MIARSTWGGPSLPIGSQMKGPATSVTVHHPYPHSAPAGASIAQEIAHVKAIHKFHASKWAGIGYSFIITQNGNVYEGRGWGRVGAHAGTTAGNQTSYGIAFLIDGTKESPSHLAMAAFAALRREGVRAGHLTADHSVKLHRDWKPDTDCPGNVLARAVKGATAPGRTLRMGMSGPDVQEVQRLLGMSEELQTGFFGSATDREVREFQRTNGLVQDSIVGPKTWAKLRRQ
jgi:N-acetylmuramoyl-L-alanine amidase